MSGSSEENNPWGKTDELVEYTPPSPELIKFKDELIAAYNGALERDLKLAGPNKRNVYQIAAIFGGIIGDGIRQAGLTEEDRALALKRAIIYFSAAAEAESYPSLASK